jgi:O-antigen biosynthesis protein
VSSTPPLPPPLPIDATDKLTFTGERFHPDRSGEMWFEHWHRYHAIAPLVSGRRVLDIASGEGYGSAHLASYAALVTGVDISADAIEHARTTYASTANLNFVVGSCTLIPLDDASIDVVVSFETLEHITEHEKFMREIKRVLAPNGLLIISTPNKAEYSDARGYQNEYHVKELYLNEFEALLAPYFAHKKMLGQRNGFHSLIQPLDGQASHGNITLASMPARMGQVSAALYVIAFASDNADLVDAIPLTVSAYTAVEDNQVEVFMQIWRHSQHLESRVADLQSQNETHVDTINALSNEINQLRQTQQARQTPAAPSATESAESSITRFIKKISR